MTVEERWNVIKENKLCSTCLKLHRRFQCRDKKKCKEKGCEAWHHILLHKDQSATLAVHYNIRHCIIYRIVPVKIYGPANSIETYAYLDQGSGITFIEESLAEYLGVEGENLHLNLKWTSKVQRSEPNSRKVGIRISAVDDTQSYDMHNVRTVSSLELPEQSITKELLNRYKHLEGIPDVLGRYSDVQESHIENFNRTGKYQLDSFIANDRR